MGRQAWKPAWTNTCRGLRGNPGLSIWWNHLLYGQPPPGLDVRTSLDLNLQEMTDQALGNRQGAAVFA